MKVLISTYSAANHSSFGCQTRELWTRLLKTGEYELVVQHGWFHKETIEGVVVPWTILPTNMGYDDQGNHRHTMPDRYGEQSIDRVMKQVQPDILWTLADPFMIPHLKKVKEKYRCKIVAWMPIDGVPVPERYVEVFKFPDIAAGITHWGADLISTRSGRETECFYHGTDFNVFYPKSEEDVADMRVEASKATDCPEDALLLGFVGKNQFRKMPWIIYPVLHYLNTGNWVECKACGRLTLADYDRGRMMAGNMPTTCKYCRSTEVEAGKPVPTRCWAHMYPKPGGIDFTWLERIWGIDKYVTYSKGIDAGRGVKDSQMAELYNMIDIYVSLSGGEGFCIPIIEASACGKPTVYTNYSGQAEIGELVHGLPVEADAYIHEHHTQMMIDRAIPSVADAVRQILKLRDKDVRRERGAQALAAAHHYFDWNVITSQWHERLKALHKHNPPVVMGAKA